MPHFLLVPIRIDALFTHGEPVMQALADFRGLPWLNSTPKDKDFNGVANPNLPRDVHPEVACISENFVAEPFNDVNLFLPEGVHLHWAVPDALTVGRHQRDAEKWPDPSLPLEFPAIPNRWLVVRSGGPGAKKWVVESDFLWPTGAYPGLPLSPVTWPLKDPKGEQPYRFLGRARPLTGGYIEDATADFLHLHEERLTAFGYGDPHYHAFYPDSRSVLGLHDGEFHDAPDHNVSYQVFGWYADRPSDSKPCPTDAFKDFVDRFNGETHPGYKSRDAMVRRVLNFAPDKPLDVPDYRKAFLSLLDQDFQWKIDPADIPLDGERRVLLDGIICYGQLHFDGTDLKISGDDVSVVVGNSGTEALSAFLAERLSDNKADALQFENQLEALTLMPRLQGQAVDLGPKFEEARHEKSFTAVSAGVLWTLRPALQPESSTKSEASTKPATSSAATLPSVVSDALDLAAAAVDEALGSALANVNRLQSALNRGRHIIGSQRHAIYADWYKYMLCCYRPVDSQATDYPHPDLVRRFVEMEVVELYVLQALVGELTTGMRKDIESLASAIAIRPGNSDIHLDLIPEGSIRNLGYDMLARLEHIAPSPSREEAMRRRAFYQSGFTSWCQGLPAWCDNQAGASLMLPDELLASFRVLYDKDDPAAQSRYGTGPRSFLSFADLLAAALNDLVALLSKIAPITAAASAETLDIVKLKSALSSSPGANDSWKNAMDALGKVLTDTPLNTPMLKQVFAKKVALAFPTWLLQSAVAPRYWQPNEPVLLLAGGPAVQASDRHGEDGDLPCSPQTTDIRGADDAAISALQSALGNWSLTGSNAKPFAARSTGGNPWHPLFLEWETNSQPVRPYGNVPADQRRYSSSFVRENYSLGEKRGEFLHRAATAPPTKSSSVFTGRSLITPNAMEFMKSAMDDFVAHATLAWLRWRNSTTEKPLSAEEKALLAGRDIKALVACHEANASDIATWSAGKSSTLPNHGQVLSLVLRSRAELLKPNFYVQAQALSGFNAALLMRRQSLQLPIADPLAFPEYKDFTESVVRDAVADQNHTAPEPLFDFQPIRAGDLRLMNLRLVDNFGRPVDLDPSRTISTSQMASFAPWLVSLPPRLSQPARVNFRFLAASGAFVETNSQPLTSPVCGWVIANNLDGSLMIHDTGGLALGYVDLEGCWRPPPGRRGPVMVEEIPNPHLAQMVKWICTSARESESATTFMRDFLQIFDTALDNIAPESSRQSEARALLMSRPVALVRVSVDLQLQGGHASHYGWEVFRRRLAGQPLKTDDYLHVQFPMRIGDHKQFNDGVVGYWVEENGEYAERIMLTDDSLSWLVQPDLRVPADVVKKLQPAKNLESIGRAQFQALLVETLGADLAWLHGSAILDAAARSSCFYAPQSDVTPELQRDAARYNFMLYDSARDQDQQYPQDINFYQAIADPPSLVSVLMDPRGLIHCHSGVLPTKALSIPSEHYVDAMNCIGVTFLTAPVLTDPGRAVVPLPEEPGYTWSWVQKDATTWTQLNTTPVIFLSDLLAVYPADGQQVWQELLAKNWLALVPGTFDRATLVAKDKRDSILTPSWKNPALTAEALTQWTNDVKRALDLCARVLESPHEEARFDAVQEIREGWLTLTPES